MKPMLIAFSLAAFAPGLALANHSHGEGTPAATNHTASVNIGALSIQMATIPESPGGVGAAYLTIVNDGSESDWIIAATCDAAESVEFHTMSGEGGTMRMRPMGDFAILPGSSVDFKPGGDHIMLIGLARPLKGGDTVTLKLTFDRHGAMTVPIVVSPRGDNEHDHP